MPHLSNKRARTSILDTGLDLLGCCNGRGTTRPSTFVVRHWLDEAALRSLLGAGLARSNVASARPSRWVVPIGDPAGIGSGAPQRIGRANHLSVMRTVSVSRLSAQSQRGRKRLKSGTASTADICVCVCRTKRQAESECRFSASELRHLIASRIGQWAVVSPITLLATALRAIDNFPSSPHSFVRCAASGDGLPAR